MAEWTEEEKQEIIKAYQDRNPTPDNSIEIVKELADEYDKTTNGVRIILSKAEVYVKKAQSSGSKDSDSKKEKKESKADSITRLKSVIENSDKEVQEDIIDKLTGKAAAYFADIISSFNVESESES